jgi:uncharacterized membrane protein YbhN (UPF0104 family)
MEMNNQPPKGPAKSMVVVRLAVLALVFAAIGFYLYRNWEQCSEAFRSVSAGKVALILFVSLLTYIVNAVIMKSVLVPYSIHLGNLESFEISMATRFGNLLLPFRGGAVARAVYLNKRYQLSPGMFVASLSGMLLTSIFTGLLWVGTGLVFIGIRDDVWFIKPLAVVLIGIVGLVVLAMIRIRIKHSPNRIVMFAANLAEGWVRFASHKGCLVRLVLSYSALVILQSWIYVIILNTDTLSVDWSYIVVLSALGNVSLAFQVTPGNAGVYEGLLAAISSLMGLNYQAVLAAGLTWRVIDAVFVFIVGGLSSRQLIKRCAVPLPGKTEGDSTDSTPQTLVTGTSVIPGRS